MGVHFWKTGNTNIILHVSLMIMAVLSISLIKIFPFWDSSISKQINYSSHRNLSCSVYPKIQIFCERVLKPQQVF
jgi:hypothetical protein